MSGSVGLRCGRSSHVAFRQGTLCRGAVRYGSEAASGSRRGQCPRFAMRRNLAGWGLVGLGSPRSVVAWRAPAWCAAARRAWVGPGKLWERSRAGLLARSRRALRDAVGSASVRIGQLRLVEFSSAWTGLGVLWRARACRSEVGRGGVRLASARLVPVRSGLLGLGEACRVALRYGSERRCFGRVQLPPLAMR